MQHFQTTTNLSITQVHKEANNLIKPYKINPLLKSKAQWRCLNPSDISHINKHKPKMISLLEITRIDFENIEIRSLCRAIKDFKRASSLNFLQKELNSNDFLHLINTTNHWKDLGIWNCGINREVLKALRLRRCKSLESLAIPSDFNQSIKEEATKDLFRQVKGLAQLKSLDIDVNKHNLAAILDSKLHWRSMKNINLTFLKKIKDYQKLLSEIEHVETLKLHFRRGYNMEVSDAQTWVSFFQKAQNLKNFILILEILENRGPEGFEAFLECFQHLKQVTHLQSHFSFTSKGGFTFDHNVFFDSLCVNLGALVQLQSLDLKIAPPKIQNSEFLSITSALQRLRNLQNLVLYFSPLESPAECVISLAECLKNLKNLEVLDLTLRDHDINRKSLAMLFQNIAHLPLKSLGFVLGHKFMRLHHIISSYPEIQFRFSKIANFWKGKQDPTSLFSPFVAFRSLTRLNLDLTSCYISAEEFKSFSVALKQMNKLSSLALELPQFDPSNHFEGLGNFLSCFKDLPSFLELDLIYSGACSQDKEIALLSSNLKECTNLKGLSLGFPRAAKLNGRALDLLLFGLQDLIRLRKLCLGFVLTKGFEESVVWGFLSGLIGLKDLEVLQFSDAIKVDPYDCLNAQLPAPLKEFENLRHLHEFILGVRFI